MSEAADTNLAGLQQLVLDCIRGRDQRLLDHLADQGPVDLTTRLGIYSNAYRIRLKETIETDHPILCTYLGDELFTQMADGYIEACPSNYPSLRFFCDQLGDYLNSVEPFSQVPVISELAAFETALQCAFDAADSGRVQLTDLSNLEPEQWPDLTLEFHPSVAVFEHDWNTVEIWQALKQQNTPPEAQQQPGRWLIWRNQERLTEFRSLESHEQALLISAMKGYDFSALTSLLAETVDQEAVPQIVLGALQQWLTDGLVSAFRAD